MSALTDFLTGLSGSGFTRSDLIKVCREQGLWATIDDESGGRAIITRQRSGRRDGRPRRPAQIEQEANGFIVSLREPDSPRPLAVPTRSMNHAPNAQTVNKFLTRAECPYDITVALDGTVVSLYKWHEKWCMGTARGYDVSGYTWIGDKTHAAAFAEAWAATAETAETADGIRVSLGPDGRLAVEGVSDEDAARFSWTLGYSHPDFHALADAPSVWQIQAVELRTGRDCSHEAAILAPPPAEAPRLRSMRAYRELLESEDGEFPPAFAGYVFRSRDPVATRDVSDFTIEAPRMSLARRLLYERPPKWIQRELTSSTRPWYYAVSAWCRGRTTEYQSVLGAVGKDRIARVSSAHDFLSSRVHAILLRHLASGTGEPLASEDPVRELARRVEEVLLRAGQRAAPTDPKGRSVIGDLLKGNDFRLDLTFFAARVETDSRADSADSAAAVDSAAGGAGGDWDAE